MPGAAHGQVRRSSRSRIGRLCSGSAGTGVPGGPGTSMARTRSSGRRRESVSVPGSWAVPTCSSRARGSISAGRRRTASLGTPLVGILQPLKQDVPMADWPEDVDVDVDVDVLQVLWRPPRTFPNCRGTRMTGSAPSRCVFVLPLHSRPERMPPHPSMPCARPCPGLPSRSGRGDGPPRPRQAARGTLRQGTGLDRPARR